MDVEATSPPSASEIAAAPGTAAAPSSAQADTGLLSWFRTFEDAVAAWSPASHAEELIRAEQERAAILQQFPLDSWPHMTVEQYAPSADGESFTSWLQERSKHLGKLSARHAGIHNLIFKDEGQGWRFPQGYRNVNEAWSAIRAGYIRAFELAGAGDYATIDSLEAFKPGRLTLHKALHVYFPDRFLPISATSHLKVFAQRVLRKEWKKNIHEKMGHCQLNAIVIENLKRQGALAHCSPLELMCFLDAWTDPDQIPLVYKIYSSEEKWKDYLRGDHISVGNSKLLDLRKYDSIKDYKKSFTEMYAETYNQDQELIDWKSDELWIFRNVKAGSVILSHDGGTKIRAVGVVKEPGYDWRIIDSKGAHLLPVQWDESINGDIGIQPENRAWELTRILMIEPRQFDSVFGPLVNKSSSYVRDRIAEPPITFQDIVLDLEKASLYFPEETVADFLLALQAKRFVILTGISGTGKTQLAMALAERFPLVVSEPQAVSNEADGAVVLTVKPSMRRNKRFNLPRDLVSRFPDLEIVQGGLRIKVHYPGGSANLTTYSYGSSTLLTLKGPLWKWFEATFPEGQPFVVEPTDFVDERPTALRLREPARKVQRSREIANAEVVAVRPDWTDNRGLLGYLNPITDRYVITPFLRLLLEAQAEVVRAEREGRDPHPFFAVLDEMNLARVEHYFSDFLSALESGKPLDLHGNQRIAEGEVEDQQPVPQQLPIPRNLFFVGTVNVDETTYMFSPKVLDRAFTIELNDVDLHGLAGRDALASVLRLDQWNGALPPVKKPSAEDWQRLGEDAEGKALRDQVIALNGILAEDNRHFGYRVANEIARFVLLAREQASAPAAARGALDLALLQKVLPKLHGTQQELGDLLDRLLAFARGADPANPTFPRMARKLARMHKRLHAQGFTAFVE